MPALSKPPKELKGITDIFQSIFQQEVEVTAGAVAYALTPHGEGEFGAWFDGRLGVIGIDGAQATELIDRAQSTWWVKTRTAAGVVGWTDRPDAFDGKDRFGG